MAYGQHMVKGGYTHILQMTDIPLDINPLDALT
jgi:hypothetical protein